MLTLAFDTATATATSALVRDGHVLGERVPSPARVLADAQELLRDAGADPQRSRPDRRRHRPGQLHGSADGDRHGARARLRARHPRRGVSTLDALAAGAPGALPVIDARRREVFTLAGGAPAVTAPADLRIEGGTRAVGDGAVRYRAILEELGAEIPPDDSPLHVPRARFHALLARDFGDAELIEPLYLRIPDAEQAVP